MNRLTDGQLIEEVKERFQENKKALNDLRILTKKLEQVNRKLQESEAMKSDFLSNIRNEMNNPLTSIMGLSRQLISGASLTPESVYPVAGMIHSEAFSLDFQLRNIFAAAELEAGEITVNNSTVDIDALMKNVIDMFRFRAFEKNLAVSYAPIAEDRAERAFFRTDPEKLQLIVSNLLNNAIEFSHDKGRVKARAWIEGGYLNLSVEDHGVGIDAAEQTVIFDRFKQLDSGSKKRYRGHGLGLSITKDLVGLLLGTISVSSAPDKGSLFTVTAIPEIKSQAETDAFAINGNVFIFEENIAEQRI